MIVLPVQFEGEVKAVIELASFSSYSEIHLAFLDQLTESIGVALNTIAATMRTEGLLNQAQTLAAEYTPGDLIILGRHRLLCGNSSSLADVDRLLDGLPIHLVNTDPA